MYLDKDKDKTLLKKDNSFEFESLTNVYFFLSIYLRFKHKNKQLTIILLSDVYLCLFILPRCTN